jgi:UDP-glucose 6-dehydrogenase
MQISIIGAGHVGLVTGACFAQRGHQVLCVDCNVLKVEDLRAGRMPFFEPGLGPLVDAGRSSGRLRFETSCAEAVEFGTVIFICVPTPASPRPPTRTAAPTCASSTGWRPRSEARCTRTGSSSRRARFP